jgi:hypothetical protein
MSTKRYTNETKQVAGKDGFIYGWQKAKAQGNTPACYHVGCYGEGRIRTYESGLQEAIMATPGSSFHVKDMFLTKGEAQKWTEAKCE